MRALLQRVKEAEVRVAETSVSKIGPGLLVFLGVKRGDGDAAAARLAERVAHLRLFPDGAGKMGRSLLEAGGEALVVSEITLYGDVGQGTRPSFTEAAPPDEAKRLCDLFALRLRVQGLVVKEGEFRAHMEVRLVNDGPVTFLLDE